MPVLLSFKFDQGQKQFNADLGTLLDGLKDFRGLFKAIVDWFEGVSDLMGKESPIIDIFKSEGSVLGASWENSIEYENWKNLNWQEMRVVGLPIGNKSKQVLTGHQLGALLSSQHPNAVREYGEKMMIYGVENEYSEKQQEKKHILDVYDKMDRGLERLIARWIVKVKPSLEMTE